MPKCVRCRREADGEQCPVCGGITTERFDQELAATHGGDLR